MKDLTVYVEWEDYATKKKMEGRIIGVSSRSGVRKVDGFNYIEPVVIVIASGRLHQLSVNEKLKAYSINTETGSRDYEF